MQTSTPDRMDMRIRWMLAVAGAILCVIGWFRYLS
jgi:hypothetical protein